MPSPARVTQPVTAPATPTTSPLPPTAARTLPVAGLERLSLVDWPGRLAAVVFTQGCPWACPYCHNPDLISRSGVSTLAWDAILVWLRRRTGLLDGVVFSGGEPTLHEGLGAAMDEARALGFAAGLHTGGFSPRRLDALLPRLAWVGFDLKAPFTEYTTIVSRPHGARARESLRLLLDSGVPCEIRTTWHPALLDDDALVEMAEALLALGCARWTLQRFRPDGCRDPRLPPVPAAPLPLDRLYSTGITLTVR